jgi:hypothetical protein
VFLAARGRLRARIGWLADVVGMRAGRIDLDLLHQAFLLHQLAEYAFRRRRAADVTETYEQNFNHKNKE